MKSGTYLDRLASQVEKEEVVLANEPNMRQLARHEVLQNLRSQRGTTLVKRETTTKLLIDDVGPRVRSRVLAC